MYLWVISRKGRFDYGEYIEAVVAAPDATMAKHIHPGDERHYPEGTELEELDIDDPTGSWVLPSQVKIEWLGYAAPGIQIGVVVARFKSG